MDYQKRPVIRSTLYFKTNRPKSVEMTLSLAGEGAFIHTKAERSTGSNSITPRKCITRIKLNSNI